MMIRTKKIMPSGLIFFISLLWILPLFAQEAEVDTKAFTCGTTTHFNQLMETDVAFQAQQTIFERIYQQNVQSPEAQARWNNTLHTVPVVVHIVHGGAPINTDANPTDGTIQNTINVATQRFRHTQSGANTYTNPNYGADTEIEFCLATTDPDGNPTSGIIRHYDEVNHTGTDSGLAPALKTNYAWDETRYCNLFIVTDLTNANAAYLGGAGYDFTIYDSDIFWSGIVAHELGHYFSLRHPQDSGNCTNNNCLTEGDFVCDTPPQPASNVGKGVDCNNPPNNCTTDEDDTSTNNPYRSVAMGGLGDQPDMVENYMDFLGNCWDSFTEGQKVRMKTNITTNRTTLVANTVACATQPAPANDAGIIGTTINQVDECTNNFTASFVLTNYGTTPLTSATITMENKTDGQTKIINWTGNLGTGATISLNFNTSFLLPVGEHALEFRTSVPNNTTDDNPQNDATYGTITYLGGDGCSTYDNNCMTFHANTLAGTGNITTVGVMADFANPGTNTVKVCAQVQGDVNHSTEVFTVKDENGQTLGTTAISTAQCTTPSEICFDITAATFNAWAADGMIYFDFDPIGPTINPTLCTTDPNQACIKIIVPINNCVADLTVSDNPTTGDYQASQTIVTSGICEVVHTASFKAGNSITLATGFYAKAGSNFTATIESCNTPFVQKESNVAVRLRSSTSNKPWKHPTLKIYPNPLQVDATVTYQLPESGPISISIFNQFGQLMREPINQKWHKEGKHNLPINPANFQTGVYYLSLQYQGKRITKKMVCL